MHCQGLHGVRKELVSLLFFERPDQWQITPETEGSSVLAVSGPDGGTVDAEASVGGVDESGLEWTQGTGGY